MNGLLISGCDVPGCCPGPLTAWAAGVFREEPQPGTIAGPLAMDEADADGRFELAARRPPVFLCASTGAWFDCAAP